MGGKKSNVVDNDSRGNLKEERAILIMIKEGWAKRSGGRP